MANFCGGDFHSFPGGRGNSSTSAFHQKGTGGRQGQGVSQWGRQQLDHSTNAAGGSSRGQRGPAMPGRGASGGKGGGWAGDGLGGGGGGGFQSDSGSANRMAIQDLSPHLGNTSIVGAVVMKHSVHAFPDKRNPGAQRFKFTFTLRDTPVDYVNVTCWGSEVNYLTQLHGSFKICDIVEIVNGQILSKTGSDAEEKWSAWTPSPYQINISETYSTLSLYSGPNHEELSSLAHAPLRPVKDCHTLSSILASGQAMDGTHVSILAAVRHVGRPKEMTSKSGKPLKKCEVKLMDKDCPSFSLFIWDEELIQLAQTWTPKNNIIHAVDVKASFDTYHNCMTAVCDQRTLIITNPDCSEAYQLYQFSQSVEIGPDASDLPSEAEIAFGSPHDNIANISEVFSIEDVKERQRTNREACSGSVPWKATQQPPPPPPPPQSSFTGILYPYLTQLNITGDSKAVVCYRCSVCKFRMTTSQTGSPSCSNKSCPSFCGPSPSFAGGTASDYAHWDSASDRSTSEPHFNLWVSLSDCTGELEGVWLGGQAAIDILGCLPTEFLESSEDQKIALKNKLHLEKYKVYFKSFVTQADQKKPLVKVLSMSLADPRETAVHMTVM